MSVAFTTPTGSNFFTASVREELRKAYSERLVAALFGAGTAETGASYQISSWVANDATAMTTAEHSMTANFWSTIQQFIQTNCGRFTDPTVTDYIGESSIPNIGTLAAAAGQTNFEYFCKSIVGSPLYDSVSGGWGFRYQATQGAALTYPSGTRRATINDYTGTTHLAADLIAAFGKLTKTRQTCIRADQGEDTRKLGTSSGEATAALAQTAAVNAWDADARSSSTLNYGAEASWTGSGSNYSGRADSTGIYFRYLHADLTNLNKAEFYTIAQKAPFNEFDAQGSGVTENTYIRTETKTTGFAPDASDFNYSDNVFGHPPATTDWTFSSTAGNTRGWTHKPGTQYVILSWNFTNA